MLRADAGTPLEAALAAVWASDPRTLRVCAQAQRALGFAIGSVCRDEALADLTVLEVLPDPTLRRLRVWLRGPSDMDEAARGHVLRRLAAARAFLRLQVAAAIHCKRTPELAFELLCGTGDAEGCMT